MSTLQIPGLIKDTKSDLTEAEIQAQRNEFAKQQKFQASVCKPLNKAIDPINWDQIPNSVTNTYSLTPEQMLEKFGIVGTGGFGTGLTNGDNYLETTPTPNWVVPNYPPTLVGDPPYYQPPAQDLDYYKKFFPQEAKKYGPSPNRQLNPPDTEDYQKAMLQYLKTPKKSAFEEVLDTLFSTAEKEQFLIDIGYMIEKETPEGLTYKYNDIKITRKMTDGSIKRINNSLDDLFLKEITVKFKNLLLAKATLKLRLPDVQVQNKEEAIS